MNVNYGFHADCARMLREEAFPMFPQCSQMTRSSRTPYKPEAAFWTPRGSSGGMATPSGSAQTSDPWGAKSSQ